MPQYPAYSSVGGTSPVSSVTATDATIQVSGSSSAPTLASEGVIQPVKQTVTQSGQGSQGPSTSNDCAFMAIKADVSETWLHLQLQTGSTWTSTTSKMDVGIYDNTGARLWAYALDSNGGTTISEATMLGTVASTVANVSIAAGAGVAVNAGEIYYISVYMASNADGLRGTNALPAGFTLKDINQIANGKLAGQTKCPSSFTPSSLIGTNVAMWVGVLTY